MKISKYQLATGEKIPRGYGVSYLALDFCGYVCHRYPLNILIGLYFKCYWKIRYYYVRNEYNEMQFRLSRAEQRNRELQEQILVLNEYGRGRFTIEEFKTLYAALFKTK